MSAPPVSVVPKGDVLENFPTDPFVLSNQLFKNALLKRLGRYLCSRNLGNVHYFTGAKSPKRLHILRQGQVALSKRVPVSDTNIPHCAGRTKLTALSSVAVVLVDNGQ